jgi:predicted DNA-binding transcriptional regulator YafY
VRQWRTLIELTRWPEGRSVHQLERTLKVGHRTLYRDLKTLELAGFRVARARSHGQAVWRMEGAPPVPISLTEEEIAALALASHLVLSFQGSPFHPSITTALKKIQGIATRETASTFEVAGSRFYAGVRRARPYTRKEIWFRTILEGLRRHRALHIKYFTHERGVTSERDVDPYGLLVHEGAFYLIGWCHTRLARRTFLVDRIQYAKLTDLQFAIPGDFSLKDHFKNAWNILQDKALVTVRIRFGPRVARIIREGRWHESQSLESRADGGVVLTVRVAGWEEIKRWIAGFGAEAEVLEPKELRESLAADGAALVKLYRA